MHGKPNQNAPDFRLNKVSAYQDRLKEWLRRFHGVAANNLPTYLGRRWTLEALDQQASHQAMMLGAIGPGPYQKITRLESVR